MLIQSQIFFLIKHIQLDAKRNDFIEVYFKLLIKYEDTSNSKHITTNFILYNMENGQRINQLFI